MKEKNNLLIFILTIGVFGIINTEMGVLGILPLLAEKFSISIAQAGLLVSLFALAVAGDAAAFCGHRQEAGDASGIERICFG
jgi:predicted MFS family arabinose efflux permease